MTVSLFRCSTRRLKPDSWRADKLTSGVAASSNCLLIIALLLWLCSTLRDIMSDAAFRILLWTSNENIYFRCNAALIHLAANIGFLAGALRPRSISSVIRKARPARASLSGSSSFSASQACAARPADAHFSRASLICGQKWHYIFFIIGFYRKISSIK